MNYKKLSSMMLFANFISTLFYSSSFPYIYANMMQVVPKSYLSFESIASCICIALFGTIWNKYGDRLYKHYLLIMALEVIADSYLFINVILTNNLKFYFILSVIISSVITRNIMCGGIKMRAKVNPTSDDREHYDNNSNTVYSVSTILGSLMYLVFQFDGVTLFILALIGSIVDNFLYTYVYIKIKNYESNTAKSVTSE